MRPFHAFPEGVSRMFHAAALTLGRCFTGCFTVKLKPVASTNRGSFDPAPVVLENASARRRGRPGAGLYDKTYTLSERSCQDGNAVTTNAYQRAWLMVARSIWSAIHFERKVQVQRAAPSPTIEK